VCCLGKKIIRFLKIVVVLLQTLLPNNVLRFFQAGVEKQIKAIRQAAEQAAGIASSSGVSGAVQLFGDETDYCVVYHA